MRSSDISITEAVGVIDNGKSPLKSRGLRAQLMAEFIAERSGDPDLDRHILKQCVMRQNGRLTRYLALIAVLAGAAPLLGLLGTVLGMIQTFEVISFFGTGNAKALAGGISVALVTTQSGLLIAIPGLFCAGILERSAGNLGTRLDEITTILDRTLLAKSKASEREKHTTGDLEAETPAPPKETKGPDGNRGGHECAAPCLKVATEH
jgi:biopolymer transport protein ExbB